VENGVNYIECIEYVREARKQGLKAPVLFMGELWSG
jgi:tryptophan synthase